MVDLTKNAKPLRITIELLWGLPGSGKSEYANQKIKQGKEYRVIDGDVARKKNNREYVIKHILSRIKKHVGGTRHFILDGLFYDDEFVDSIFTRIKEENFSSIGIDFSFEITVWNEDRENCITNDFRRANLERRGQTAFATIKHSLFNPPSKWLLDKYGAKVNQQTVYQLKPYQKYFAKFEVYGDVLKGEEWCGGGTSGNCYNSHKRTISAETPRDFDELDDLLEKMCGDIGFLKYKKLRALATTEEKGESDYYGGYVTNIHWEINLKDLYDKAVELGLIGQSNDY